MDPHFMYGNYPGLPPSAQPGNRGSGDEPQRNSAQQGLGATVPEISGHHVGGEETFLSRFDSVKVRYEKRGGKLVIDLPQGISQDLAEQLESLIKNDLRCQWMLSGDSSKIKRHKSGPLQIRFPVHARAADHAIQRVSRYFTQLIEQCEHLRIADTDGFTKFTAECRTLARALGTGALDFRRSTHLMKRPDYQRTLIQCVGEALNHSIIEIIDVVSDELKTLFRNEDSFESGVATPIIQAFDVALERGDEKVLVRLVPFYSALAWEAWAGGKREHATLIAKVVEFCREFPAHAGHPYSLLGSGAPWLLQEIIHATLERGDCSEAARLLVNARKNEIPMMRQLVEKVIISLCTDGRDPKAAWKLYKAHVLAGEQPSAECTQVLFQTLEKDCLLRGEGPEAPRQQRTMREWGSRFRAFAGRAAKRENFALVSRYVEFITILAINEKDLLADLESLAVTSFHRSRVGEIVRKRAEAYLESDEVERLAVATAWQSAMAEAQAWFKKRELASQGYGEHDFAFTPIDEDQRATHNSFADYKMTIKLAQGWALNPDDPALTRTFKILSYVIDQALDATKKKSVKGRQHVAELIRAINEMVRAVDESPSAEVRNRGKALRVFLHDSKELTKLIGLPYEAEQPAT
jgi:hypothetical protein